MLHWTWVSLVLTAITAIYDIVIVIMKKKTISWWIHSLFNQTIDYIVMFLVGGIIIKACLYWGNVTKLDNVLGIMLGVVIGHLFWNSKS
jgi:hypothetical protein